MPQILAYDINRHKYDLFDASCVESFMMGRRFSDYKLFLVDGLTEIDLPKCSNDVFELQNQIDDFLAEEESDEADYDSDSIYDGDEEFGNEEELYEELLEFEFDYSA